MDPDDRYPYRPYLSEKDILYELFCRRNLVLKDRELEAGYAACKKYAEIAKAPHVLRLQFDCATRLGYKDEAAQIALLAAAQNEITAEMYFSLGEYFFNKKDLRRARDHLSMANAVASSKYHADIENIAARSLIFYPKESEKEQRTMASLASSVTEGFDQCMSLEGSDGSESLPLKNRQKQAAPAQSAIVYQPLPMRMGVAKDTEVEKVEKSIFLCFSNWIQGRYGCDWYRLDLLKKECSKIFGRLEWGGIPTTGFGVATVGSIIYLLGGLYPESCFVRSRMDWTFCYDVFYLDVNHPRDGWKAGPQLPSPHFEPVATSMNETVYIFNGKYVFARALDTSDFGSGWKSLAESPDLESLLDIHFRMAFPDPIRDRILLLSHDGVFFAYYPREEELECVDSEFKIRYGGINFASAIVDGVLYHNDGHSNQLLWAYDLDQRKLLTSVYNFNIDVPYVDFLNRWKHLLDLGGGKLCLVKDQGGHQAGFLCLKLKVQKEAGGDKVIITVLSFDTFWVMEDMNFMHSVAL